MLIGYLAYLHYIFVPSFFDGDGCSFKSVSGDTERYTCNMNGELEFMRNGFQPRLKLLSHLTRACN